LAESIKNVKKKCLGGIKEDSAGQAVYEKSLQIIKSVREFLAQSVGSKNVSLQNIAMNFCGCWSFSLEKIPIGGLKKSMHAPRKTCSGILLASYLRTHSITKARLFYCYTDCRSH
jgi:hypothetical protein